MRRAKLALASGADGAARCYSAQQRIAYAKTKGKEAGLAGFSAWLAKSAFPPGRNAVGEARAGDYREKREKYFVQ